MFNFSDIEKIEKQMDMIFNEDKKKKKMERIIGLEIEKLKLIGENPDREGLKETPLRMARMYNEVFKGYDESQKPKLTVFPNGKDGLKINEIVTDSGYFFSHCEHHMVPFFGNYYFAYIPGKYVIGISKIARLIDWHASRLQIQERLVKDIVDDIEKEIKPQGVALIMKARHLCKEMRGVKKVNSPMSTSEMRGAFKKNAQTRQEFLSLIKL